MDLQLDLECKVMNGVLHARYFVANHGTLPLLCYDGAPGEPLDAPFPDLLGQLYISVAADTLALKRILPPPPPDGIQVNRVFIPPLSQTMPGERREVRFQLKEPVAERSEYTPDYPGAQYNHHSVPRVRLYLGCFWKTESMQLQPFAENAKAFRLRSAHGPQSIITADASAVVSVKERTDNGFLRI